MQHSATLLPSGKLLAAAGTGSSHVSINSAELYLEDFGINDARRPVIATATNPVALGGSITVSGTGLSGVSEAANGSSNSSATNYSLLQLRRVDNDQVTWTAPASGNTRSATATSGLPVTYSTSSPACTVNASSGLVTAVAAGTCVIAANQAGNTAYAAAPQVTQTITIGIASQIISFGAAPALVVGGSGNLSATSDKGLVPVTLTSSTPSVCSVSGNTVTGISTGVCTIQANQAGNATYNAASATLSFRINAAPVVCDLRMNGVNPLQAAAEGLILTRAMLGFTGNAVTAGTGIVTPWPTIRDYLNANCGTSFQ